MMAVGVTVSGAAAVNAVVVARWAGRGSGDAESACPIPYANLWNMSIFHLNIYIFIIYKANIN